MKKKLPEQSRPFAPQAIPLDYKGDIPKLSQAEIIGQAKRDGEILKAHGVTMSASKAETLQAKKSIEPPLKKEAQAPPQAEATAPKPLVREQQKEPYQFSEKAKEFFAKSQTKTKEQPQKEQTKDKPREKDRER